ncbi:hypothetical protein GCM10027034_44270 [Ramlibacter solisilvae]
MPMIPNSNGVSCLARIAKINSDRTCCEPEATIDHITPFAAWRCNPGVDGTVSNERVDVMA